MSGLNIEEGKESVTCRPRKSEAVIERLEVAAYVIPTSEPEADGTYEWDATTLVVVQATAGGRRGLGYTYADEATARFIDEMLADRILGFDAFDATAAWGAMTRAVRNLGRPGVSSMAVCAVDIALWDLKSILLELPLAKLLGAARRSVPVYGSGGFTSYDVARLKEQLAGWAGDGIHQVKMKVGAHPPEDLNRVRAARDAIGPNVELFVDANGAYSRKQALRFAEDFVELGVTWFEEPVFADDLDGLRLLRDRAPAGMEIAAGEYGYDSRYFRRMLEAGTVDVLQADATRCAGITGFLHAAALCESWSVDISTHCAPSVHVHLCCAVLPTRHLEYFYDHVRIEHLLFDGVLSPVGGSLHPDMSRPGLGIELKRADAARYLTWESEKLS